MSQPREYIIIDLENRRFVAEKGFTTQREFAKKFPDKSVHQKIKKLREDHFLKITFECITEPIAEIAKKARATRVKNCVKQVTGQMRSIVETVETAKNRVTV